MMVSQWVGFEAAAPFCFPPGLDRSVHSAEQAGSLPQPQRFLGWHEVMTLDSTTRRNDGAVRQVNPVQGSSMRNSNLFNKKMIIIQIWCQHVHKRSRLPNFWSHCSIQSKWTKVARRKHQLEFSRILGRLPDSSKWFKPPLKHQDPTTTCYRQTLTWRMLSFPTVVHMLQPVLPTSKQIPSDVSFTHG